MNKNKSLPKYVQRLIDRREQLASKLLDVCEALDKYCESIGIDVHDPEGSDCLFWNVEIYTQPTDIKEYTESLILKRLNERKEVKK